MRLTRCARRCGGSIFKFFHVSDMSGDVEPAAGDAVTYALGADRNGNA
jgi:hypothetical protein